MKALYRALALVLISYGLARAQSVSGGGGSGNVADGGTNGGVYRDSSGALHASATGGAGTLCFVSSNGGVPVFGSCAGTPATAWDSLSAPSGNLAIAMSTNLTAFTWSGNTSTNNLFSLKDTTGNTGTGSIIEAHSVGSSVAKPFTFTAQGTANGIQMSSVGAVAKIGTGSIAADTVTGFSPTSGKTLSVSNTLTLAGTDSTVMTFPSTSATIARTDAANTFTGTQTVGVLVATTLNGNTFTTGTGVLTIGAGKTATINNTLTFTGTDASSVAFGTGGTAAYTANNLSVFAATTSAQLAGVISNETGSGLLMFGTAPTASGLTLSDIATGTQCLHANSSGVVSGTGSDCGSGGSTAISSLTAAAGGNTIANGDNAQVWNWATTTSGKIGMIFGETTASTSAATPYILQAKTLIGSTATPLNATNSLNGSQTLPALSITPTWNTTGVVDAALLVNVTNTASGTASKLLDLQVGGTSEFSVDKTGAVSTPGTLSSGVGSGVAGGYQCLQGTASTGSANSIILQCPTSVTTAYTMSVPSAAGTGFILNTDSSNVDAWTFVGFSGTGNVMRVASPTSTGTFTAATLVATTFNGNTFTTGTGVLTIAAAKTLTANNSLTLAGTDGTTETFPSTSATIARTDAAQTFTGVQTFGTAIAVGSGGTGASTLTAHGPLVGETTSAIVATSPGTSGQCYLSNGASSDPSFQACPGGAGAGNSVTSTTPVTVNTNTTSDQQLMELSLGAGYFNSSKQPFLFDGAGVYTTQTAQTPTITLKIKLCTVSGCGSGTVVTLISIVSTATIAAVTNNNWNLAILGYTATTGATGNLEIHGPLAVDLGALTTTADSVFVDTNTAVSSNIDLTAALFVDYTIAFSTNAVTANTFTQRSGGVMPFAATAAPVTSVNTKTGAVALTLNSSDFANEGTTVTVLHGAAAGNPSFSAVSLTADVSGVLPTANIAVALANQTSLRGNAMAVAAGNATIGQVIATGNKALDFASTATGACATVITDTATGALSTDRIVWNTNASIKAVTGYVPASTGGFSVNAFPSTDLVSFEGCNWTSGTVDPGSITVNWMVIR